MKRSAEQLYEQARELPTDKRVAFLNEACRDDPGLRDELLSLLANADAAERFFDRLGARVHTTLPPSMMSEPSFESTVRNYRLLSHIGSGGMGTVYRALDTRLNREVALKFLPEHLSSDPEARQRLLSEARAAASLDHPNVCNIFEIAESEEGRPFIAMALCAGETLRARMSRSKLSLAEAVDTTVQIARALAAAHTHGIVHRDVKPGNIMIGADNTAKLLDFGVARFADAGTTDNATLGTIAYMSPEQIRGEKIDARSDLWSLGVVLYEMLAGERPFRGDSPRALADAILRADPIALIHVRPETPDALAHVVDKLLQKDVEARYSKASEVVVELTRAPASPRTPAQVEQRRLAALQSYDIMETPPDASLDRLILLATRICNTPVGYIKFFDDKRAWFKAKVNLPEEMVEVPREFTMCNFTVSQTDLVVIPDASVDDRFRDHPRVIEWPHVRFYCSMPIIDDDGYALGTFCVFDSVPHELTVDQQEAMRTLAQEAMTHLELHRTRVQLNMSTAELERARLDAEQERTKARGLLCQILPRELAAELIATGQVRPRYHSAATVLIAEFCNVAEHASSSEADHVINTLNRYFSAFDGMVERHGLEKIKTVGDMYLCAAGVPVDSRSQTIDACLVALEMQAYVAEANRERIKAHLDPWQLRIALHVGPSLSGMVGRMKFTYDLWGDVVADAQRLKVAAAAGQILISESVQKAAVRFFEIAAHEPVIGDGNAVLKTYRLVRIIPQLCADVEGQLANARFAAERLRDG